MTAVYPSYANTFVRDHDATNKLVVDYARNISAFPINRYAQIVPVKKIGGLYLNVTVEEAGRILASDLSNFIWMDGDPAPEPDSGTESFEWLQFLATRRAFTFKLGSLTIEQASWDVLAQHASIKARQAMTARTQLMVTQMLTSGNYDATHYVDVTAISGNSGTWAASTSLRQDIKRSLFTGVQLVKDATLSAVGIDDMVLTISDTLAGKMAMCQEIVDMVKQSPSAMDYIRGGLGPNAAYGLPPKLYGVDVVIEDTRKVTSRKGATRAVSNIFTDGYAQLGSRPGGLIGLEGGPNFSTNVIFAQEEMTTYKKDDPDNRRVLGRVVDTVDAKIVAPASGVLFYNCD